MAATKVNLKSAGDLTMLIFPYKTYGRPYVNRLFLIKESKFLVQ